MSQCKQIHIFVTLMMLTNVLWGTIRYEQTRTELLLSLTTMKSGWCDPDSPAFSSVDLFHKKLQICHDDLELLGLFL